MQAVNAWALMREEEPAKTNELMEELADTNERLRAKLIPEEERTVPNGVATKETPKKGLIEPLWFKSVCHRVCAQFGHLGLSALQRFGASYRFFRSDKNNAKLMCKHCHSLLVLTKAGQHFTKKDDFKLLAFLLLEPIKHPECISK